MLKVGDRVELKRDTTMHAAGHLGTIEEKYVPPHCTGVWCVVVRFDGDQHLTSFPHGDGSLSKL